MARPMVRGKIKVGRAKIHDYVLPKAIVYLFGVFGGILLAAGLILTLVGLTSMPGVLMPWGFVVMGIGWCLLLMSLIFCCHAFCIKPTRGNPYYIKSEEPRVVVVKEGSKKAQLQVVPMSQNQIVIQGQTGQAPAIVVASAGTTPEYEDRTLRRDISGGSWSTSRPTSAVAEKDLDFQYYSGNQVHQAQPQVVVIQGQPGVVTPQGNQEIVVVQQQHGGRDRRSTSSGPKEYYIPSYAQGGNVAQSIQRQQSASSGQQSFVIQQSPAQHRAATANAGQRVAVVQSSPQMSPQSTGGHVITVQHQQSGGFQQAPNIESHQTVSVEQNTSPGVVLYRPPASGGISDSYETKVVSSSSSTTYHDGGASPQPQFIDKPVPIAVQAVHYDPQPQKAMVHGGLEQQQQQQQSQGSSYQNEYSYSYSYQTDGEQQQQVAGGNVDFARRGSLYDN